MRFTQTTFIRTGSRRSDSGNLRPEHATVVTVSARMGTVTLFTMGVETIISSLGARAIGIAIGTGIPTIGGMGTVAVSLTTHGSSSISGSSPGTVIPTMITTPMHTVTMHILTVMTQAFTRA